MQIALIDSTCRKQFGIVAVNKPDLVTSVVTFGSLSAYSLLNIAVMRHFASAKERVNVFRHCISPIIGLLILTYALWSATAEAKWLAGSWLAVGVIAQWGARSFFLGARVAAIDKSER